MNPEIEVVSPGALASIQDLGRFGWRRVGAPRSGVLDPAMLRIANRLVGNPETAPAIEFFAGGLCLAAAGGGVHVGCAGDFVVEIEGVNGRRRHPGWRSFRLAAGERLRCLAIRDGRVGVVAVAGLSVAPTLGSASTTPRAGLGGIDGRLLGAGTRLSVVAAAASDECVLPEQPRREADGDPIRVVLGPQDEHFTAAAVATLLRETYRVSTDADRMGMRLAGPALAHRPERGAEIVSDATVPGSIQVPGNGQPIVLLADGQTVGGYPKIATVISADLPRLATRAPGAPIRFAAVDVDTAEAAARERERRIGALLAGIVSRPADAAATPAALHAGNLISGVVDALATEPEQESHR